MGASFPRPSRVAGLSDKSRKVRCEEVGVGVKRERELFGELVKGVSAPPCVDETPSTSETPCVEAPPCASGVVTSVPGCVLPSTPCVEETPCMEERTCVSEAPRVKEPACLSETTRVRTAVCE